MNDNYDDELFQNSNEIEKSSSLNSKIKKNKKLVLFLGMVVFVVIGILFFYDGGESSLVPVISNKHAIQYDDDRFFIPVENVTDDKGYADGAGDVQYVEESQWIVFSLSGMYKGNSFSKTYYGFDSDKNSIVLMAIRKQMEPKNGVVEGYMVETFENGTPYVYIYLDEDWRKQIDDTNIIWGKDLQFIQKFEWINVGKGIYMNKIKDDIKRFPEELKLRTSGVFVGDITLEDTKTNTGSWTMIMLH